MPRLQIDGKAVAELTAETAKQILKAVEEGGLGREPAPQPSGQLDAPLYSPAEYPPKPIEIELKLEFAQAARPDAPA